MRKAFTITELLVAVGLLAAIIAASALVFSQAVKTHRTSQATAELNRKFQAITHQIKSDISGLRKNGEIAIIWQPVYDSDKQVFYHFDRMHFFANGNFTGYHDPDLVGNVARISYSIAKYVDNNGNSVPPHTYTIDPASNFEQRQNERNSRILARTQHIMMFDNTLTEFPELNPLEVTQFTDENFNFEYDWYPGISLRSWINIPSDEEKADMLSVITGVTVNPSTITDQGPQIDIQDQSTYHMLLCEDVVSFRIQGWLPSQKRWYPQINPDGDDTGDFSDSDYYLIDGQPSHENLIGIIRPSLNSAGYTSQTLNISSAVLDDGPFEDIPVLGNALKFTFTLYDSRGIFPDGKVFSYIIYIN